MEEALTSPIDHRPRWFLSRDLILRSMAALAILIGMGLLASIRLPDYFSYRDIYNMPDAFEGFSATFRMLVAMLNAAGVGYGQFRLGVGFLGGLMAFLLATRARPSATDNAAYFYGAFALLAFPFVFEFFEIRLRGGLGGFLFMLALLTEMAGTRPSWHLPLRAVQAALLVTSFALHPATAAALALFALPPLLYLKYRPHWLKLAPFLIAVAVLAGWTMVFYRIVDSAYERGADLFSPLNPVRFAALTVVPALIFLVFQLPASRLSAGEREGIERYPQVFSLLYLVAAAVLTLFFLTGWFDVSGEAVVRVMTLSSFPAALIVGRWGIGYDRLLPAYLLACNGAFFIHTVYF